MGHLEEQFLGVLVNTGMTQAGRPHGAPSPVLMLRGNEEFRKHCPGIQEPRRSSSTWRRGTFLKEPSARPH